MTAERTSKLGKLIHPNWLLGVVIACSLTLISFEWKFMVGDVKELTMEDPFDGDKIEIPITRQIEKVDKPKTIKVRLNPEKFVLKDDFEDEKDSDDDWMDDLDGDDLFSDGDWWDDEEEDDEIIPWNLVEKMPYIKGCDFDSDKKKSKCTLEKIYKRLGEKVKYPDHLREQGIEGKVMMKFTVDATGQVVDIQPLNKAHKAFIREAEKGVSSLPEFIPAEQMGKAVSVVYTLPIEFSQNKRK